jgi:cytochrome P450
MAIVYDPRDPATTQDPLPILRRLQDEEPVHWSPVLRGWVITRYDDVRRIQMTEEVSADRLTPFYARMPEESQQGLRNIVQYLNTWVAFKDPPDHTRTRRLLNQVFTIPAIEALRPVVKAAVEQLLPNLAPEGEHDFVQAFAFPLPAIVIMRMLGLPPADMTDMKTWSDMMQPFIGGAAVQPEKYRQAEMGAIAMADYFRRQIRARAKNPTDDMISKLLAVRDASGGLSEDEIVGNCMLFLFGGHETTTNLIGNGVRALLAHPAELAKLRGRPELLRRAIEEILRFDGPTGGMVRVVKVAHELHGRSLEPGQRVFIMVHGANHDPRRFERPDTFDIERHPNPHLTFNSGVHFCLGAPLARLEGEIAIGEVVKRLPQLSLARDRYVYMDTMVMRGVREMLVRNRAAC